MGTVHPFQRPSTGDARSSVETRAPWKRATGLAGVIAHWEQSRVVEPCLVANEALGAREASFADFPPALLPQLADAVRARGVDRLYTHQARAFAEARARPAMVVATPTASGKSYCFHLPVLQALIEDPDARAIYLYPTKALARDQEAGLRELMAAAGMPTPAIVFDGDTPADARRAAKERSRILLTNPDMLHSGILPHHTGWARTVQNLAYVVVDELHTYRGVFGSHVANVLTRLMRVAHFHGSSPRLIGATATIGNPREHAARLFGVAGEDVACITESGAPAGTRRFFMYNPPVVNAELGVRASYVKQAVYLAADLVRARVPTILFGHSRNNVEVMLRYLRERVRAEVDASRIQGYRGGYLPDARRSIEARLRSGDIACVVATNALELGIDIGDLDAVVCAGYPGSVAATWQRFGRAGRRSGDSVCVLVTSSAPLDQYLAREPGYFLGAPVEQARIDPDNPEILLQHLKCAAFELPFVRGERFGALPEADTSDALDFLVHHRVLHEASGTYHWSDDAYPANSVSLRSVGWDNVVIIDVENERTIAEIDWRGAHTMVHEQAIYQHDGTCWQVERFDHENHKAWVREVAPDYYTDAMTHTQVSVLEEARFARVPAGEGADRPTPRAGEGCSPTPPTPNPTAPAAERSGRPPRADRFGGGVVWRAGFGEVSVVEKVVGYKKIKFYTHENAGYGEVRLPEMQMHTTAFWLTVPSAGLGAESPPRDPHQAVGPAALIDALRGIGVALELVSTFALMCDPRDLGATIGDSGQRTADGGQRRSVGGPRPGYDPTLFLYEHTPGGIGLAQRVFEDREILLARALALLEGCTCPSGCPACVGPVLPGEGADGAAARGAGDRTLSITRKALAADLLRAIVRAPC